MCVCSLHETLIISCLGGFVKKKKKGGAIDIWALNVAMLQCEKYLKSSVHADIDIIQEVCLIAGSNSLVLYIVCVSR